MTSHKRIRPLFIGLYDSKLLGIRYLSSTLQSAGWRPNLIFLKTFNSYNADDPTEEEYRLLFETLRSLKPGYVGISVMCSFYLSVAKKIVGEIKKTLPDTPVIIGGVYATLFPEECLAFADAVCRGEGEEAIVEFTTALEEDKPYAHIDNIATKNNDGTFLINPIRPLMQDLDRVPHPDFGGDNMYYINDGKIINADPERQSYSYELTTSRGCPNKCSYCSNSKLSGLYKGKGKYIRQRSVGDVMAELHTVRQLNPGLQILRFWDEIFPWDDKWVTEFARAYKEQVGLPFEIWGHPKLSTGRQIKKLVQAGLVKIVIGVQSGSYSIRKEIYHRNETNLEVLNCASELSDAKVPEVIYDFILGHPFETDDNLREALELCRRLAKPFRLQLHGLSFLPGTVIEDIAVEKGVKTWDEIREEQSRPLREQYHTNHWWRQGHGDEQEHWKIFWYTLTFLTQFKSGERIIKWALKHEDKLKKNAAPLLIIQRVYNYRLIFKAGWRKLKFIISHKGA
jgi:radical SAM superfamily enzyme YgiQ (UPF0313 family)